MVTKINTRLFFKHFMVHGTQGIQIYIYGRRPGQEQLTEDLSGRSREFGKTLEIPAQIADL